jgi:hypothetical protein
MLLIKITSNVFVFRDKVTNLLVMAGFVEMKLWNPDGMMHKRDEWKTFHGSITFLRLTGYYMYHLG